MKSNYKRLGPYIRQVDIRNKDGKRDNLLGVSVTKEFIKSIANTVGTDFTKYKIVKKGQFTYIPDTSRRGDKIAVALLENEQEGLVSQAYTVFEVSDTSILLPEYLMMWYKRPEFDRYARFISHGSVREIFSWEDMCDVELPIPPIEEQRKIIKEYDVIGDRIRLNNRFIQKLKDTALAIYKQWFTEFEFPNEQGLPYKSNSGEMQYSVELDMDIPKGWRIGALSEIIEIKSGKTPINKSDKKTAFYQYPVFGAGGIMGYSSEVLFNDKILSIGRVGTHGIVNRINFPCWTSDNTLVIKSQYYEYVNQILNNLNYDEINRGGVQGLITQTDIKNTLILIPDIRTLDSFEKLVRSLLSYSDLKLQEIEKNIELGNLILSKISKK